MVKLSARPAIGNPKIIREWRAPWAASIAIEREKGNAVCT
jgi:hypothetical protein